MGRPTFLHPESTRLRRCLRLLKPIGEPVDRKKQQLLEEDWLPIGERASLSVDS